MEVSIDHLLHLLGAKEVEISLLRKENTTLKQLLQQATQDKQPAAGTEKKD